MAAKNNAAPRYQGLEMTLRRVFGAPRERVFRAWTDPVQLARWWGPKGFSSKVHEWDPKAGRSLRVDMLAPDGTVYPMGGKFREIVEPQRIVFTSTALDKAGVPMFENLNVVTFAEQGSKTEVTVKVRVLKAGAEAGRHLGGMEAGWSQSLVRLGALVSRNRPPPPRPGKSGDMKKGDGGAGAVAAREIVTTRVFDAPRELVFKMWTDPGHLARWWGPNGFTNTLHELDVRPGGAWRHTMHGPDGVDYKNNCTFIEVEEPERLVYRHDSGPRFLATVTFEDVAGKTRLTLRTAFATAELRDRVAKKYHAVEGAEQTLARLAEHLVTVGEGPGNEACHSVRPGGEDPH